MKGTTLSPTKLSRSPSKGKILNHCLNYPCYVQRSLKVYKQQLTAGYKHVNILVEIPLQWSTEVSVRTKWTYMPGKNAKWLETTVMIPWVWWSVKSFWWQLPIVCFTDSGKVRLRDLSMQTSFKDNMINRRILVGKEMSIKLCAAFHLVLQNMANRIL